MEKLIIEARNIAKFYQDKELKRFYILKSVNLKIYKGDLVTIFGPEGAGKSTLLRILGLMERPFTGEMIYQGRIVTSLSHADLDYLRKNEISIISAESYEQELFANHSWHKEIEKKLMKKPELLLIDEIPSRIDPAENGHIMGWLQEISKSGETIVLATSNPESASWGKVIYRLDEGMLSLLGCERKVF